MCSQFVKDACPELEPNPKIIWLEVTTKCNLACSICRPEGKPSWGGLDMPKAVFDRFVSELVHVENPVETVILQGRGESLYSSHFDSYYGYCIDSGLGVVVITNGTLLNSGLIDRFISNGIELGISLDSLDKTQYEAIRRGADMDKVLDAIRYAGEQASRNPNFRLYLYTVLTRSTALGLQPLILFARKTGAHGIKFLNFSATSPLNEKLRLEYDQTTVASIRNQLTEATDLSIFVPTLLAPPAEAYCDKPFSFSYICADGMVYPCCSWHKVIGNIMTDSFAEIWNSTVLNSLRKAISSRKLKGQCRMCERYALVSWS